jgi:hypothetical protein
LPLDLQNLGVRAEVKAVHSLPDAGTVLKPDAVSFVNMCCDRRLLLLTDYHRGQDLGGPKQDGLRFGANGRFRRPRNSGAREGGNQERDCHGSALSADDLLTSIV